MLSFYDIPKSLMDATNSVIQNKEINFFNLRESITNKYHLSEISVAEDDKGYYVYTNFDFKNSKIFEDVGEIEDPNKILNSKKIYMLKENWEKLLK